MTAIYWPTLGDIISLMPPYGQRDRAPPYLPTLALLEALQINGYRCQLWNAVMNSQWTVRVVAGIRTPDEILDCRGVDPRQYPFVYPVLSMATITRESSIEIIPGKREEAINQFPETMEQARKALEQARLTAFTPAAENHDEFPRRL